VEGPLKPKPFAVVRYPGAVRTATPVANRAICWHLTARGEFGAPFLSGRHGSV